MTQQQMQELLNVPERTLRDWKKGNRAKLYQLLKTLDYHQAEQLLNMSNNNDLKKLLENEKYFTSLRDFEKSLYQTLVSGRDSFVWLKLAKDYSFPPSSVGTHTRSTISYTSNSHIHSHAGAMGAKNGCFG